MTASANQIRGMTLKATLPASGAMIPVIITSDTSGTNYRYDLGAAFASIGVVGGALVAANNLSDVVSATTALDNLGLTSNGKSFVTAVDYSAMRTLLGLVISTNVQAYNANLTTYAGIAPSANVQTLLGAANFAAFRTSLGLGTSALVDTGTSGTKVALTDGANTWSAAQTDSALATFSAGANMTPAVAPATTAVGYLGAPVNTQNGTYTTLMTDCGKAIYHTSGSAHTWTIDSNANVAYPIGTILTFINENAGGVVTLAITSDTLRWGSSTGSRSLAANGTASAIKVASTTWRLTGDGIT
jgi:hypothetical protein